MISTGLFTSLDLVTIQRAASVAEGLTVSYFGYKDDDWRRDPYGIFTRRHVDSALHEQDAFANVIRYKPRKGKKGTTPDKFGIVLQDPNILRALLRSSRHDLWTLALFILTHELVHIVRFKKFNVDFFASADERDVEEALVQEITREILAGVENTDYVLSLYQTSSESRTYADRD